MKAYRNLHTLKEIESLDRWLKRIIMNTAMDCIKKKAKIILIEELHGIEIPHYDRKFENLHEAVTGE